MKTLSILAALGLGLSAQALAAKDLTITTWTATSPGLQDWWKVMEAKFEADNPGVDVKIENVAFADYTRTLTTRFIAGTPPTVVHVPLPIANLPAWADAGFLQDLDALIAPTEVAQSWSVNQNAMAWKGKNYGVLLVDYGFVFFTNQKLFADAGLKVPTTPAELKDAAAKLTAEGKFGFAVTDDNSPNFMRDALVFIAGMGGQWVKDGKWNFQDPAVVEALTLWRDIASQDAPKGTDINAKRQAFYDGNVAMMIENPSVWPNVAAAAKPEVVGDLHLAPMPFPNVPGDVSHGFSIPEGISADDAALAWSFTQLASSASMMEEYVKLVKSPVARPGATATLGSDGDTGIIAQSSQKPVLLVSAEAYGVRERYADFATELTNSLRGMLQGQPVAESLTALEAALSAKGVTP